MIDRWEAVWAVSDGWQRAALILVPLAAIGQLLFIGKYATRRWWPYRVGRAIMGKAVAIGLLLVLSVLDVFFNIPEWLAVATLAIILIFVWYQTFVLWTSPRYLSEPTESEGQGELVR